MHIYGLFICLLLTGSNANPAGVYNHLKQAYRSLQEDNIESTDNIILNQSIISTDEDIVKTEATPAAVSNDLDQTNEDFTREENLQDTKTATSSTETNSTQEISQELQEFTTECAESTTINILENPNTTNILTVVNSSSDHITITHIPSDVQVLGNDSAKLKTPSSTLIKSAQSSSGTTTTEGIVRTTTGTPKPEATSQSTGSGEETAPESVTTTPKSTTDDPQILKGYVNMVWEMGMMQYVLDSEVQRLTKVNNNLKLQLQEAQSKIDSLSKPCVCNVETELSKNGTQENGH